MYLRKMPSLAIACFVLLGITGAASSFTPTITNVLDSITFINGVWTGHFPADNGGVACLKATLRATGETSFSGSMQEFDHCGPTATDGCSISGTVNGLNMVFNANDCSKGGGSCTLSGTVSSSLSRFTVSGDCNGPTAFTLTKSVSVSNVSQSSGIANQNIRTTGIQWIDYNNDGRLDLFLVGSNGTTLFKNIGGGKFVNVTAAAKITNNGKDARGASWADIDNDGDLDVFIANRIDNPTLLLNNHGVFSDISGKLLSSIAPTAVGTTQAGIWVDINNDKDIDLLIVKDGAANQLFKKKGLDFTNIATAAGIADTSSGRSAVAFDANADGFQDLFVVNFNHPNKLYLNKGNETFSDISASAGVAFSGGSVQAAVADYDRDKDTDLFVVNNNGSSILYRNAGNLKFSVATPGVVKSPKKGIAAAFADVDSDGNDDLVLAQTAGGNKLFRNKGKGQFEIVSDIDLNNPDNPTGITIGDFNNDGLPDIALGDGDDSQDRGDSLYQNSGGGGNNFVILTLVGGASNKAAIGARVIVQTGLTFQAKEVTAGNGQNEESLPLEFGIGVAPSIDVIQIFWPGSATPQILKNIKANSKVKVIQH